MPIPIKPLVCIIDDKIAVFMGSDYKHIDLDAAKAMTQSLQRNMALLRRKQKLAKRAAR
jgi:hypothetical protein